LSPLGVLPLGRVNTRLVWQVLNAEKLPDLLPRSRYGSTGERDRVGPHIGDEACLVQLLCDRHRPLRGKAEFATGFLLQRRGAEGRVRPGGIGLGLDAVDRKGGGSQRLSECGGLGFVEVYQLFMIFCDQGTATVEIT